jgi:hypothetical protein
VDRKEKGKKRSKKKFRAAVVVEEKDERKRGPNLRFSRARFIHLFLLVASGEVSARSRG